MSRVYDVPSVAFSRPKSPSMPRVAQGVSMREDDIVGLERVYDRCFGTLIDDPAWAVSVNVERVNTTSWKYEFNSPPQRLRRLTDLLRSRLIRIK